MSRKIAAVVAAYPFLRNYFRSQVERVSVSIVTETVLHDAFPMMEKASPIPRHMRPVHIYLLDRAGSQLARVGERHRNKYKFFGVSFGREFRSHEYVWEACESLQYDLARVHYVLYTSGANLHLHRVPDGFENLREWYENYKETTAL